MPWPWHEQFLQSFVRSLLIETEPHFYECTFKNTVIPQSRSGNHDQTKNLKSGFGGSVVCLELNKADPRRRTTRLRGTSNIAAARGMTVLKELHLS